jgi:hypothetical protein
MIPKCIYIFAEMEIISRFNDAVRRLELNGEDVEREHTLESGDTGDPGLWKI